MNENSENKNGGSLFLYLVLGLIVMAVLVIMVLPFLNLKKETPPPPESTAAESGITTQQKAPETTIPVTREAETTASVPTLLPEESEEEQEVSSRPMRVSLPAEGRLLKGFDDEIPVYSLTLNDYRVHLGIDIASEIGDPVLAFADGSVVGIRDDPMGGRTISIDHGNGLISHYGNLSVELPEEIYEGALVACGQTVGAVGDTSLVELSDETHLHFELTENGRNIDPLDFLSFDEAVIAEAEQELYEG